MTTTLLTEMYDRMERAARHDGLSAADGGMIPGGRLHRWIQANVRYRPETECFIIFELACRLGTPHAEDISV